MNTEYRKPLPGTDLDYFDTRQAVEDIQAGAYDKLPYTSKILAEQLVRRWCGLPRHPRPDRPGGSGRPA